LTEIDAADFLRHIFLVLGALKTLYTWMVWNWFRTFFFSGSVSLVNAFNPSFEAVLGRLIACFEAF